MNKNIQKGVLILMTALMAGACSNNDKPKEDNNKNGDSTATVSLNFVRKNANKPEALADLEAMALALGKMREMQCSNPASWYYQGAMHWIPDTISNGNPFCSSYVSSRLNQLKLAWDNCTHTGSGNSSFNFLIWHRFYILHFEQIIRELSGKKDFALPYWDYTDTIDPQLNRKMPLLLRTSASPLYAASRLDSLNMGYDISAYMNDYLNTAELMQQNIYTIFSSMINAAPHGAMHNYIGGGNTNLNYWNPIYQDSINGGGLMANVPSAGFDPIFWLHHSNIDRLWQKWTNMSPAHRIDSLSVVEHPWPYVFFDSKGDTIQYSMSQVAAKMYNMNYTYSDMASAPLLAAEKSEQSTQALFAQQVGDTLYKLSVNKTVNAKSKSLVESIKVDSKPNAKMLTSEAGKSIILQVKVSFDKEPRNNYQLYLNLPNGAAQNVNSIYFVGILNFFGAKHHAMHDNSNKKGPWSTTFTFDVTDEFRDAKIADQKSINISLLQQGNLLGGNVKVETYTIYRK